MITTEDEDPMRTSVNSINFINRFLYDEEATEGERESGEWEESRLEVHKRERVRGQVLILLGRFLSAPREKRKMNYWSSRFIEKGRRWDQRWLRAEESCAKDRQKFWAVNWARLVRSHACSWTSLLRCQIQFSREKIALTSCFEW